MCSEPPLLLAKNGTTEVGALNSGAVLSPRLPTGCVPDSQFPSRHLAFMGSSEALPGHVAHFPRIALGSGSNAALGGRGCLEPGFPTPIPRILWQLLSSPTALFSDVPLCLVTCHRPEATSSFWLP